MARKLTLPTESVEILIDGARADGYHMVAVEYLGDWRWGSEHRVVFADELETEFWAYDYKVSAGDAEWYWTDDEGETVECFGVFPRQITTTVYTKENN